MKSKSLEIYAVLSTKVNALQAPCSSGRLQSQTQEELDALLPSVLRPQGGAFKGEL